MGRVDLSWALLLPTLLPKFFRVPSQPAPRLISGSNPLSLVRVKGISRRQAEPRVLAAGEIPSLIKNEIGVGLTAVGAFERVQDRVSPRAIAAGGKFVNGTTAAGG